MLVHSLERDLIAAREPLLQFLLEVFQPFLERFEFLARSREHCFLYFEFLAGNEIEPSEPGLQHRPEILLEVRLDRTQPFRHGVGQFSCEVFKGFFIHARLIPQQHLKRQHRISRCSPVMGGHYPKQGMGTLAPHHSGAVGATENS